MKAISNLMYLYHYLVKNLDWLRQVNEFVSNYNSVPLVSGWNFAHMICYNDNIFVRWIFW